MSASQAGPFIFAKEKSWQYRAVKALRGNQTQLGCVLIAVLQRSHQHGPPRYARKALITKDGVVCAGHENANRETFVLAPIMTVANLIDEWRRLADQIKATDAEVAEMFAELRRWIARDDRPEADKQGIAR